MGSIERCICTQRLVWWLGICGGMQMLGRELADPGGIEQQGCMPGLGLLPISTTMQADKVTRLCSGNLLSGSLFGQPLAEVRIAGYEIHVGKTLYLDRAEPFATLANGEQDGCISADRRVLGITCMASLTRTVFVINS